MNPIVKFVKAMRTFCCTTIAKTTIKKSNRGPSLRVNGSSKFTRFTKIGSHCNFNGIRIYGSGAVSIGDYFHSGQGVKILTQNHNYLGESLPYDATYVCKTVTIGKYVWVGDDVLILPGVSIGDGAIIQAGSVVAMDVPSLAIAGGSPAKPFKFRDKNHYDRLVMEGKFF